MLTFDQYGVVGAKALFEVGIGSLLASEGGWACYSGVECGRFPESFKGEFEQAGLLI